MRFFYADPGLRGNNGHHATFCRAIIAELRARGITTEVYAHRDVEAELRDELNALPYFKAYTYWEDDGDPICGWLTAFEICSLGTAEDLLLLSKLTRDDILYISSARPAQLMAVG